LRSRAVRIVNWLVLRKWSALRWRLVLGPLLRLYAVALLLLALYLLLYQWSHGGFADRPFEP
jgi:hypothetical protein